MRRREVADDLGDVRGATAWVGRLIAKTNLAEDVRFNIEVCVEEALANLIEHGRPARATKDIAVLVDTDEGGATVLVTDHCIPFDAAEAPSPAPPSPEDMRPGGQGLRLMRAFANEVSYRAVGDRNELTLRFRPTA